VASRLRQFADDEDFQLEFDLFRAMYGKTYENAGEMERRKKIFISNILYYSA
jgi:hypothetical protein